MDNYCLDKPQGNTSTHIRGLKIHPVPPEPVSPPTIKR